MCDGRLFHRWAAATGSTLPPSRDVDEAERSRQTLSCCNAASVAMIIYLLWPLCSMNRTRQIWWPSTRCGRPSALEPVANTLDCFEQALKMLLLERVGNSLQMTAPLRNCPRRNESPTMHLLSASEIGWWCHKWVTSRVVKGTFSLSEILWALKIILIKVKVKYSKRFSVRKLLKNFLTTCKTAHIAHRLILAVE